MDEESKSTRLVNHIKEYVKLQYELAILKAVGKSSKALSKVASSMILWILLIFMLLFLSLGLAWWVSSKFDNSFLGFFIIGAFYLLVFIVLYLNREKWLKNPTTDYLLKNFTDEED